MYPRARTHTHREREGETQASGYVYRRTHREKARVGFGGAASISGGGRGRRPRSQCGSHPETSGDSDPKRRKFDAHRKSSSAEGKAQPPVSLGLYLKLS